MVILNKIYTKTGDSGETALGNGARVAKFSLRVEAYGTVDELNSFVGVSRLHSEGKMDEALTSIQNDLFDLGADLATPIEKKPKFKPLRITSNQVVNLEKIIDQFNKKLSPLNSFILPGGSESASFLHNARTVARRAETQMVTLSKKEKINDQASKYINRLSDLLFVLSRVENKNGKNDILWKPGKNT